MLSYAERAKKCKNQTAVRFLNLLEEKKTNLAVAVDMVSSNDILSLLDKIGPEICLAKTHIDIINDFSGDFVRELTELKKKHNFMVFEDRKFADIGNTVKMQYSQGIYHIVDWADIVNAHTVPGPGIIEGLKEVGESKGRGLLLLAEMSSDGNLAKGEYTKETLKMAKDYPEFVIGFITMKKQLNEGNFINFTPGVKLKEGNDKLGQRYNTPEKVIKDKKCDVIIVGRGIYEADDPVNEAKKYREAGWKAYMERN